MKLASSILFAVLALAGCGSPTAVSSDLITAQASNKTLQITNNTNDRVYYFVAESSTLPLLDWAVCIEPTNNSCQHVEAHATAAIAYSQIVGQASAGERAVVFHWKLIPAASGKYQFDSIRNLLVDLE